VNKGQIFPKDCDEGACLKTVPGSGSQEGIENGKGEKPVFGFFVGRNQVDEKPVEAFCPSPNKVNQLLREVLDG